MYLMPLNCMLKMVGFMFCVFDSLPPQSHILIKNNCTLSNAALEKSVDGNASW